MHTLILGAQGQLGSGLMRHARRAGLGWQGQGRKEGADIVWSSDQPPPPELFPKGGTVINMVGHAGSDAETLHRANVAFTGRVLTHAKTQGVAHVILASSAAVYGDGGGSPLTEDAPLAPLIPYGHSKVEMEDLARAFAARQAGPAITVLRIGNVAGADALTRIARARAAEGQKMDVHRFADGTAPVRSYIGPRDLFRAVAAVAAQPPEGLRVLNVAAPLPVDLEAVLIAYQSHLFPDLKLQDTPTPAGIPPQVILSTRALQGLVEIPTGGDYTDDMARQVAQDLGL